MLCTSCTLRSHFPGATEHLAPRNPRSSNRGKYRNPCTSCTPCHSSRGLPCNEGTPRNSFRRSLQPLVERKGPHQSNLHKLNTARTASPHRTPNSRASPGSRGMLNTLHNRWCDKQILRSPHSQPSNSHATNHIRGIRRIPHSQEAPCRQNKANTGRNSSRCIAGPLLIRKRRERIQ
jgi:hypothetical protein